MGRPELCKASALFKWQETERPSNQNEREMHGGPLTSLSKRKEIEIAGPAHQKRGELQRPALEWPFTVEGKRRAGLPKRKRDARPRLPFKNEGQVCPPPKK